MAATTPPSISFEHAYRWHRKLRGEPRELLIASALRLELPELDIELVDPELQARTPEHIPDITVLKGSELVAELEITGTDLAWQEMRLSKVFVLPSKVEYAKRRGERYIYVYVNNGHLFSTREAWLLWLPGPDLVRAAEHARTWTGRTVHGKIEKYYMIPRRKFKTSWHDLVAYIRYLAGELADPRPGALANFMAR